MVTAKELRGLLNYDPETGVFTWLSTGSGRKLGQPAGFEEGGHRYLCINRKRISAAKVAWAYSYGEWPTRKVASEDGDSLNLRLANLRLGRTAKEHAVMQRVKHKDKVAARNRRNGIKRYKGMDMAAYQRMFVAQGGVCAICKQEETVTRNGKVRWLCVDHCHTSEDVRGLLCVGCNAAIGYAKDNPAYLRAAADYLEAHAAKAAEAPPSNVVRLKG